MYGDGPFHLLSFGSVKHECSMPKCVIHLTGFADTEWIETGSSQNDFRGQQFIQCSAIPLFSLITSEDALLCCFFFLIDACNSPMQIAVTNILCDLRQLHVSSETMAVLMLSSTLFSWVTLLVWWCLTLRALGTRKRCHILSSFFG